MSTPMPGVPADARPTPAGPRRPDPDARLVEKLREEDPEAPEQLVATFGDRVYRLAIRITGNEQDAEEVVQDALWTAARKIGTSCGSWALMIATAERSAARTPVSTSDADPVGSAGGAAATTARRSSESRDIARIPA